MSKKVNKMQDLFSMMEIEESSVVEKTQSEILIEEVENLKTEFLTNVNNIILKENTIPIDKSSLTNESINEVISILEQELITNNQENLEINELLNTLELKNKELDNNIKTDEENNNRIKEHNLLLQEEIVLKNQELEIKNKKILIKKNINDKAIKPIKA